MSQKIITSLLIFKILYSKSTYKILHISDIHQDSSYLVGAPDNCWLSTKFAGIGCCRLSSKVFPTSPWKPAGRQGEMRCDTPRDLVIDTLEQANKHFDIDHVIQTGDSASHNIPFQTVNSNSTEVEFVFSQINEIFKDKNKDLAIGNHDTWVLDQFSDITGVGQITKLFYKLFQKQVYQFYDKVDVDTIASSGSYARNILDGKVKLISFNSNVYDSNNLIISNSIDPFKLNSWLEKELNDAVSHNQKVWMIMHEPSECSKNKTRKYYFDILQKQRDILQYEFSGHTHQNEFNFLYQKNEQLMTSLIGSSVTQNCHQASFRIIDVNIDDEPQIENYSVQLLDYDNSQKQDKLIFEKHHDFKSSFNLPDVSKDSLKNLSESMLIDNNLVETQSKNKNFDDGCQNEQDCIQKIRDVLFCDEKYQI